MQVAVIVYEPGADGVNVLDAESEPAPGGSMELLTFPIPPVSEHRKLPMLPALTVTVIVTLCPSVMFVEEAEMPTLAACAVRGAATIAMQRISAKQSAFRSVFFIRKRPPWFLLG